MAVQIAMETLVILHCANCSMLFGIPKDFENRRREDHEEFFCPKKHSNYFPGKSDTEKLRDQLDRERASLAAARAETEAQRVRVRLRDRQIRARKGVATRLRNKLVAGRCPCCSHEFKDLKRHLKIEHPKWNLERAAEALAAKDPE